MGLSDQRHRGRPARWRVPRHPGHHVPKSRPTFYWTSIALSSVGLVGGIFAIIEGSSHGWWSTRGDLEVVDRAVSLGGPSIVPVLAIVSVAVLAGFALWERHVTAAGRIPLSMSLFTNTEVTTGAALTAAMSLGMLGWNAPTQECRHSE